MKEAIRVNDNVLVNGVEYKVLTTHPSITLAPMDNRSSLTIHAGEQIYIGVKERIASEYE